MSFDPKNEKIKSNSEERDKNPNLLQRQTVETLRGIYKGRDMTESFGITNDDWSINLTFENSKGTDTCVGWDIQSDGKITQINIHRDFDTNEEHDRRGEDDEPGTLHQIAYAEIGTGRIIEDNSVGTPESETDPKYIKKLLPEERKFLEEAIVAARDVNK